MLKGNAAFLKKSLAKDFRRDWCGLPLKVLYANPCCMLTGKLHKFRPKFLARLLFKEAAFSFSA